MKDTIKKEPVLTCCGKDMSLNVYEPDQDTAYVGYDCPECGSSFYGEMRAGE